MGAAITQLIPVGEMSKSQVSAIRNSVIESLVAQVSRELHLPPEKLVVRDIRYDEDLVAYSTGTTSTSINDWLFTSEGVGAVGYNTIADSTMTNQRYVALFGAKDFRETYNVKQAAATDPSALAQTVGLIRLTVGGAQKVIWDFHKVQNYRGAKAGITSSAVVIPQNVAFKIEYYKIEAVASTIMLIVLDGVVVEPRGLVVSP